MRICPIFCYNYGKWRIKDSMIRSKSVLPPAIFRVFLLASAFIFYRACDFWVTQMQPIFLSALSFELEKGAFSNLHMVFRLLSRHSFRQLSERNTWDSVLTCLRLQGKRRQPGLPPAVPTTTTPRTSVNLPHMHITKLAIDKNNKKLTWRDN